MKSTFVFDQAAQDELSKRLNECAIMRESTGRRAVFNRLDLQIRVRIKDVDAQLVVVRSAVAVCADFPGGIESLIDAVRIEEGYTFAMREVVTWFADITGSKSATAPEVTSAAAPEVTSATEPEVERLGDLWRVPELPPHFLPRDDDMDRLIDVLCADTDTAVGITDHGGKHGVYGMGGIGKSVLAAAVAQSERIRARFVDGVYWIAVRQMPNILSLQMELAEALGLADAAFKNADDGKRVLSERLARRRVLLVLDDVWRSDHAKWLEVMGAAGRLLLTTRNLDVLTYRNAMMHSLDTLSLDQARALMAGWTGTPVSRLPETASLVAERCGRLPFALAIAGALVRRPGGSWDWVLRLLDEAQMDRLPNNDPTYPYENVYQVIEASVSQLAADGNVPHTKKCYADLAVFADEESIPLDALHALWSRHGLDETAAHDLASALATYSLATLEGSDDQCTLRLHDLQRAYVSAETNDVPRLHKALVDAYQERCERLLAGGRDGEIASARGAYVFTKLPHHLIAAGRADKLRRMLGSYAWLDAKLRAAGVAELVADFERIECVGALALVRDALRLSSHVLARDAGQLPGQLLGRLGHFESHAGDVGPTIRTLLTGLREQAQRPWLCPDRAVLEPPGGPLVCTLEGHTAAVWAVALSPDGASAFSGSWDSTIKQWDTHSGRLLRTFEGHKAPIMDVALTGKLLLSGSQDHTAVLWDSYSGHMLCVFEGHEAPVMAVALSADGIRALSGSQDHTMKLWDTRESRPLRTFEGHAAWVNAVALSEDGSLALSGSDDTRVRLWDTSDGTLMRVFEGHQTAVTAVALSADSALVLSGSEDKTLKLWDAQSGALLRTFEGHAALVTSVSFSQDNSRVLSGAHDQTVRLWDTWSGEALRIFEGHSARVNAVALGNDGVWALSGSDDMTVKLWDTTGNHEAPRTQVGQSTRIMAVALNRDGRRVLSGSSNGTVTLWGTQHGFTRLRVFEGHTKWVCAVALSADGTRALSGSQDNTVKLWNPRTGELLHTFEGHSAWVNAVALSANKKLALSGSDDKTVKLWDTRTGRLLRTLEGHLDWVRTVTLSRDGTRAVSGSWDNTLKLWDTGSGRLLRTFEGHSGFVNSVALSEDGTHILSGSEDRSVKQWETRTGRLVSTLVGHSARITSVALSEDGTWALSGSGDKTIRLWDMGTGRVLFTFTADWPIPTCALASGRDPLICAGDQSGRMLYLRLLEDREHPDTAPRRFSWDQRGSRPGPDRSVSTRPMAGARVADDVRPEVPSPSSLEPGTQLGNYRITGLLDRGGMGVVYQAQHVDFGIPAVIKMLLSHYADNPEIIERFNNEARALARIRHPSIVRLYDVGEHHGHVYMVLERLHGESLAARLGKSVALDVAQAITFTQHVARALGEIHDKGIIHRDLKPDNLFIVPDPEVPGGERVKILDFGIAKRTGVAPGDDDDSPGNTQRYVAMGTREYMPPEQWLDARTSDERTDLYALGVILFRMLCGRLPFIRETTQQYKAAHLCESAPALKDIDPRMPDKLSAIVADLLAKRQQDRPRSAGDLVHALDDIDPASLPTTRTGEFGPMKIPMSLPVSVTASTEPVKA